EAAGGSARASTPVRSILMDDGHAVGVRTSTGKTFRAPHVVSAIGARETVKRLLLPEFADQDWAREVLTFRPSICHFQIFLGFEGDIARYGATKSNHWFYDSWDTDTGIWSGGADEPLPMLFVSFPSLKDPAHEPGPSNRHTGEAMVWADWSSVVDFANGGAEERPSEWSAFKKDVESKLLGFFHAKFPALAPLVVHCELGTPLATAAFTGHENGGFYGVETTPRRVMSDALQPKTPVPGLYLSGQDAMMPGIAGALWGGMLGAAAVDPRVFRKLRV
ncbi:MAG: NAD(P)/FAD-dependent oxidoreductase, partial [Planctomycetes bacterium]|nr:NAD(P)/FAD-dependent oxidoreductase [Planctomycetota bacterium]